MTEAATISVPAGRFSETDLMAALEVVVRAFRTNNEFQNPEWFESEIRSADWLKAKFGSHD